MSWCKLMSVYGVIGSLLLGAGVYAGAEEKTLEFPSSSDEIIKLLDVDMPEPPAAAGRGGLGTSGNNNDNSLFGKPKSGTRGLGGIAEDEEVPDDVVANAPKVGALILFDSNSATMKPESIPLLKEFVVAFQSEQLKDMVLVVAGHTDSKGRAAYNLDLSRRRAEAVKQFLLDEGQIDAKRLLVKPYGEEQPLVSNDTAESRAQNRRVEFVRIQ